MRADDETSVYGDAFAALKAGRYDDAARGFELYLTKYPDGPRADNAELLARRGALRAEEL